MTKKTATPVSSATPIEETKAMAVVQAAGNFMDILEMVRDNPEQSAEVIHRLIDANERVLDRQSKMNYTQSMARLRKELAKLPIIRKRKNTQTKSNYADLQAIKNEVDPLLAKYDFYDHYDTEELENGKIRVVCTLCHIDGHSVSNGVEMSKDAVGIAGTRNKTDIHAESSAITYGQRISLCLALGIRFAEDDDGNKAGGAVLPEHLEQIQTLIDETDTDIKEFCELFEIEKLSDLPMFRGGQAIMILKAKKRGKKPSEVGINDAD